MASPAFLRKAILASALLGALYASFFMPDDTQAYQSAPIPEFQQQPLVSVVASSAEAMQAEDDEDAAGDPFAPRMWLPPASVPESVKPAAATREVVPIELPQGPPALPFKFAGRMNDGDDQVIYLARGETALVARNGDVLENNYKIVSINASQIEFEHLPTGQKQALSIPVQEH